MQPPLWHDTIHDALRALVDALGGPKRGAVDLWPARDVTDGQRYVLKCLDAERPEKLGLEEFVWLMRRGREARGGLPRAGRLSGPGVPVRAAPRRPGRRRGGHRRQGGGHHVARRRPAQAVGADQGAAP